MRAAAAAGIAGPIMFFGVVLVEGWLRPDFDPMRRFISELSLGPRGWIQSTNFIVFGVLLLIFAFGMRKSVAGGASRVGSGLLMVLGIAVIGCGLFRAEPWPPSSMSSGGLIHLFLALAGIFTMMPVVCFVFARAFAANAEWRSLVPYSVAAGVITLLLFAGALALTSSSAESPRIGNSYGGLIQRLDVGVFLTWQIAAALRLRRSAR